ncbi:hypothetical protein ABPG77_007168 [Micractinium sp. CCAP 211/92]
MQVLSLPSTTQLVARPAAARRQRRAARVCAQQQQAPKAANSPDEVDDNIGAYCSLDEGGRRPIRELTTGQKEQLFLEAMASYYYDGIPLLSDSEFDNLKQELQWEGSKVVVLSKEEQQLLEARLSAKAGKPIMSDAEYDALKAKLAGSGVFQLRREGPVCSLDRPEVRGKERLPADVEWGKMVALRLPAVLAVGGVIGLLDVATGGAIAQLPGKIGVLFWGGLVVPSAFVIYNAVSTFLFKDPLVLKAPCPNCGEVNTTYFGDILTVAGSREKNVVKCPCCESQLTFDAKEKEVVVTQLGNAA